MEIEEVRLLEVHGVAGTRHDEHAGTGDDLAHHQCRLHARLVLVPDDDERRHAQLAQPRLDLLDRRSTQHDTADEVRAGRGRVLAHVTDELVPPSGILQPERASRRIRREVADEGLDALALDRLRRGALAADERVALDRACSAADHHDALRHRRMGQREVQRHVGAHRAAGDVGLADAEPAEELVHVLDQRLLGIRVRVLRYLRRRVAAGGVGDDAITPAEVTDLLLPRPVVAAELVTPHQREALAGLLVVQIDAVDARGRHDGSSGRGLYASAPGWVGDYRCVRRSRSGGASRPSRRSSNWRAIDRPPSPKASASAKTRPPNVMPNATSTISLPMPRWVSAVAPAKRITPQCAARASRRASGTPALTAAMRMP